jgi:hypothetical protein
MDDIIVFGETFTEPNKHLKRALAAIRKLI